MRTTAQNPGQETRIIRSIAIAQLILLIIVITIIKLIAPAAVKSAIYGSMVALLNTIFLYWRMRKAELSTSQTAGDSLKQVQRAGLERFLLVTLLLGVGMAGNLKLMPITVLISFIIGQLVFLLGVALPPRK